MYQTIKRFIGNRFYRTTTILSCPVCKLNKFIKICIYQNICFITHIKEIIEKSYNSLFLSKKSYLFYHCIIT